ncbi:MAG: substrate-binding domain-containing protein [Lachnospiraceae bacterium]|nr:substrate-binding domain-containing protein [Lachnospiraceae bacterium]
MDIMPYVNALLDSYEQVENYTRKGFGVHGRLLIAVSETILIQVLQPVFAEFYRRAPDVHLVLRVLNSFKIRDEVIHENLDFAVMYDIGSFSASVITHPLMAQEMILVGGPDISADEMDFVTPNQQKPFALIVRDNYNVYGHRLDDYLHERNISLRTRWELGSNEAVRQCVMYGIGVAFLPKAAVAEELKQGCLLEIPTELESREAMAILAYNKNRWISPAMKIFTEILFARMIPGLEISF